MGDGVTIIDNARVPGFRGDIPAPEEGHGTGLNEILHQFDCDFLMTWETDVIALRHNWLQWFIDQMTDNTFAVGYRRSDYQDHYLDPSCTLYRTADLRKALMWCRTNPSTVMRAGKNFENEVSMSERFRSATSGPFSDKRGWPKGTVLKSEHFLDLPGWWEPGQLLSHWAEENDLPIVACQTATTYDPNAVAASPPGLPTGTFYGMDGPAPARNQEIGEMWGTAATVHLWAGSRILRVIKHSIDWDQLLVGNASFWLQREARFWRDTVDRDIQEQTLALIRKWGWHLKGFETAAITQRDRDAVVFVHANYAKAGVVI
jgi:hypothetical protein